MILSQRIVLVPFIRVSHLNKPDTTLRKSSCQQTLVSKASGLGVIHTVQLLSLFRFSRNFLKFGSGKLHSERKFKRTNSALKRRIWAQMSKLILTQRLQHLNFQFLSLGRCLSILNERDLSISRINT